MLIVGSADSSGVRADSSRGLEDFSLSHVRNKTKGHLYSNVIKITSQCVVSSTRGMTSK